ncbi:DUF916 and DUF3324 domain-containing protein [Fructilactobacillus myrtifloralis]|uniref:DUF916 and DUF3324 domain-containing protein n=1 Tax=Fructilactobacillus myrtifloralis TaxID=2940301 RepID=A0ABY5BM64_9LACO|nr:DUF916 domain-containing protein [Fructilactobacillus myrtifloralis]USS84707.1 DUF916 and DUF3324 domain-containing protein [Fructilactobacillus myrtifloralis]
MNNMTNKRLRYLIGILCAGVCLLATPSTSWAQNTPDAPDNFSVSPLLGDLPLQPGQRYFALRSQDNTTYKLPILVKNDSELPMKVTTNFNNAVTADNGTISYTNHQAQPRGRNSLTNKLSGSRTRHLTLEPHSNQVVIYELHTGRQGTGVTLGGITATSMVDRQGEIKNTVTFVNGVELNSGQNRPVLSSLRLQRVFVAPRSDGAIVVAKVANPKPQLLQHLRGKITVKQGKRTILTQPLKDVSIAPNSTVKFTLPPKQMPAGNYQVVLQLHKGHQATSLHRNLVIKRSLN